jgi:hypothetical protein
VEVVATPLDTGDTPLFGAPTRGEPFSVKVTVPTLGVGELVMVAVKVTNVPLVLKVALGVTLVDVEWPVPGETSRHHPPLRVVVSPMPEPL